MNGKAIKKGIFLMLLSSFTTCAGQLCWKLSSSQTSWFFLILGFGLYGVGALLMITALKFGDLSVLHPMLSAGYILSFLLGAIVLHEQITITKIVGVLIVIIGLILISTSAKKENL